MKKDEIETTKEYAWLHSTLRRLVVAGLIVLCAFIVLELMSFWLLSLLILPLFLGVYYLLSCWVLDITRKLY